MSARWSCDVCGEVGDLGHKPAYLVGAPECSPVDVCSPECLIKAGKEAIAERDARRSAAIERVRRYNWPPFTVGPSVEESRGY